MPEGFLSSPNFREEADLKVIFTAGFMCLLAGGFAAEAEPVTAITLGTIGIIVSAVSGALIHRKEEMEELFGT